MDIAILKLLDKARMSTRVQPICLAAPRDLSTSFQESRITVAGWNVLADSRSPSYKDDTLRSGVVRVADSLLCEEQHEAQGIPVSVTDSMFCAGRDPTAPSDICTAETGGIAAVSFPGRASPEPRWHLVGLVSWSYDKTCSHSLSTAFTKVLPFKDWIERNMKWATGPERRVSVQPSVYMSARAVWTQSGILPVNFAVPGLLISKPVEGELSLLSGRPLPPWLLGSSGRFPRCLQELSFLQRDYVSGKEIHPILPTQWASPPAFWGWTRCHGQLWSREGRDRIHQVSSKAPTRPTSKEPPMGQPQTASLAVALAISQSGPFPSQSPVHTLIKPGLASDPQNTCPMALIPACSLFWATYVGTCGWGQPFNESSFPNNAYSKASAIFSMPVLAVCCSWGRRERGRAPSDKAQAEENIRDLTISSVPSGSHVLHSNTRPWFKSPEISRTYFHSIWIGITYLFTLDWDMPRTRYFILLYNLHNFPFQPHAWLPLHSRGKKRKECNPVPEGAFSGTFSFWGDSLSYPFSPAFTRFLPVPHGAMEA